jgi:hypothetical protein
MFNAEVASPLHARVQYNDSVQSIKLLVYLSAHLRLQEAVSVVILSWARRIHVVVTLVGYCAGTIRRFFKCDDHIVVMMYKLTRALSPRRERGVQRPDIKLFVVMPLERSPVCCACGYYASVAHISSSVQS